MRLRCPVCHADAALEAWVMDEAARDFVALLAGLEADLGRPLVAYIGLFRPRKTALTWDRALRLAREVLALTPDAHRLASALSSTVDTLRAKRAAGDARPLSNHNYLKRVLEGVLEGSSGELAPRRPSRTTGAGTTSSTLDAVMRLEALKQGGEA